MFKTFGWARSGSTFSISPISPLRNTCTFHRQPYCHAFTRKKVANRTLFALNERLITTGIWLFNCTNFVRNLPNRLNIILITHRFANIFSL